MSRSVGTVEAARSLLPEEAALALGVVTQLGDVWFLLAATVLAYWLRPDDRRRTVVVLGMALATIALLQALKGLFGLARPISPLATAEAYPTLLHGLFEATATAGGQGFPSGHATLSTVVLLGLAGAVRLGNPRRRAGLAVGLIAVVSLSRIGLGVHFLVDVVAGVLVGLAVLAGSALVLRASPLDRPTTALVAAVAVAALAVLATAPALDAGGVLAPAAHDSLLALGATLGALAGWEWTDRPGRHPAGAPEDRSRPGADSLGTVAFAAGLLPLLALFPLVVLALAGTIAADAAAASVGLTGIAFAAVVALPALVPDFDAVLGGYLPRWFGEESPASGD